MPECPYCTAEIMPGLYQCPNCGSPLTPTQTAFQTAPQFQTQTPMPPAQQMMNQPVMQQPMMQPYTQSAMPESEPVVPVSSWLGYLLLCACLPLIGPIIMTVSPKEKTIRNFAKAFLLAECIGVALFILLIGFFGFMSAF